MKSYMRACILCVKKICPIGIVLLVAGCAPFQVEWMETDVGMVMEANGKLPRAFEATSERTKGTGIAQETTKYSVKSDNKVNLFHNLSLFNLSGLGIGD